MSYYNPGVYNYSNLNEKDKEIAEAKIQLIQSVKDYSQGYKATDDMKIQEKMFYETAAEVASEIVNQMVSEVVEWMVSVIDSYDEDVEEFDTDDYFYGLIHTSD